LAGNAAFYTWLSLGCPSVIGWHEELVAAVGRPTTIVLHGKGRSAFVGMFPQHNTFIKDSIFDLQPDMGVDFSFHRWPLVFNFALECVIRKVQANQKELELNGTHQFLVHVNDVNLLGENIRVHCMRRNKDA
jgi:hypothetical protein